MKESAGKHVCGVRLSVAGSAISIGPEDLIRIARVWNSIGQGNCSIVDAVRRHFVAKDGPVSFAADWYFECGSHFGALVIARPDQPPVLAGGGLGYDAEARGLDMDDPSKLSCMFSYYHLVRLGYGPRQLAESLASHLPGPSQAEARQDPARDDDGAPPDQKDVARPWGRYARSWADPGEGGHDAN